MKPKEQKPLSTLERLEKLRDGKMTELYRVMHDLDELDAQITWVKRFPQIAQIAERLRKI